MFNSNNDWKLVILHTNDSHGHVDSFPIVSKDVSSQLRLCNYKIEELGGYSHLSSIINEIRKNNEYTLLFNTGDTFTDTMEANITKGRLQLRLMNHLKYDAMCPGNHDIDYGAQELKNLQKEANFPFLAANLLYKDTSKTFLVPYILKSINELTFGIYGLTYHNTPDTTSKSNIENVKYTLDFEQIQNDIDNTREQGADFIIILSHLGDSVDELLAKEVKGLDIIIGGHSHEPYVKRINNVIISQTTSHLTGLGRLELVFKNKILSSINGMNITIISKRIKVDTSTKVIIDDFRKTYKPFLKEQIGFSYLPLIRNYKKESPIDTVLGNSLRYYTQSEISILPGVGYGITIPEGIVTMEQIMNFFPHKSSIYVCYLKGKDILEALEQSILNQVNLDVTKRVGGLIQVTGLKFTYTYEKQNSQFIKNVLVNNKPIERDKYYKTVMNQLMIEGGHKYSSLRNAINIKKLKFKDIDILKIYFKEFSPITPSVEGWSIPLTKVDALKGDKKCIY